ncbi:hypothetical protein L596_022060 [Steinernema carpocapsae]|uniref:Uncharacterized protein n=1 Tax=Steinernema carpocapsae TaxID=34508 RepID=A0A4U5MKQ1_STECR|nr:hypothetical protein L596_022060 [Steinernema carpocapsae]
MMLFVSPQSWAGPQRCSSVEAYVFAFDKLIKHLYLRNTPVVEIAVVAMELWISERRSSEIDELHVS